MDLVILGALKQYILDTQEELPTYTGGEKGYTSYFCSGPPSYHSAGATRGDAPHRGPLEMDYQVDEVINHL